MAEFTAPGYSPSTASFSPSRADEVAKSLEQLKRVLDESPPQTDAIHVAERRRTIEQYLAKRERQAQAAETAKQKGFGKQNEPQGAAVRLEDADEKRGTQH